VLPDAALALPEDWEGVCHWVMGGRIALWDETFEKAFLQVTHSACPFLPLVASPKIV
jgi:hypothetical protein